MGDSKSPEADFNSMAWTSCVFDGKNFIIKYMFLEDSYQIMISNLAYLYSEELNESEIRKRCEIHNPGIEIPVERILMQIKKCIEDCLNQSGPSNIKNAIFVGEQTPKNLELKLESGLAKIVFVWFFTMSSMEASSVSSHFILPLIGMVTELTRRNKKLVDIIKSKDEEIEDYKTNGAKVTRKWLETKPFVEPDFQEEMNESEGISKCLKEPTRTALTDSLYSTIMLSQINLKRKATEAVVNERNKAAKSIKSAKEIDCTEVVLEDRETLNRREEMQRRNLLQQQLDMKIEKKAKKKIFKL